MTHDFKRFPELTNAQMGMYYFDSPHKQIAEDFWAKVIKVVDGDTIRVETDFRDFNFPVRFSNIMAAEPNEPRGKESKKWLDDLILGAQVEIIVDENNRVGKWGRLLGQVIHRGFDVGELSIQADKSVAVGEEEDILPTLMLEL